MTQQQIASNPNGFIKQVLNANDLIQCDECGVYTGIYVTVKANGKPLHFCSAECKEVYLVGREESNDADKYDSDRDLEMEDSFDEELDSMNPDRF